MRKTSYLIKQTDRNYYLSKQISAVGGIALVACSLSGEGLMSKGAIFTSLFSSNEPDDGELL